MFFFLSTDWTMDVTMVGAWMISLQNGITHNRDHGPRLGASRRVNRCNRSANYVAGPRVRCFRTLQLVEVSTCLPCSVIGFGV